MKRLSAVLMGLCLALSVGAYPVDFRNVPNIELPWDGKPRPPIMVCEGGDKLLSLHCPVTASVQLPEEGTWSMLTDGEKEYDETTLVKFAAGVQWVQVDLRTSQVINAVCIWRYRSLPYVTKDTIVQLSDDGDFIDGVTTVFNNDHDNSARLGAGEDKAYVEWNEGKSIPVPGVRARYVRIYSNGLCNGDPFNYCTEIEVYGGEPTSDKKVPIKIMYPKPLFL